MINGSRIYGLIAIDNVRVVLPVIVMMAVIVMMVIVNMMRLANMNMRPLSMIIGCASPCVGVGKQGSTRQERDQQNGQQSIQRGLQNGQAPILHRILETVHERSPFVTFPSLTAPGAGDWGLGGSR